MSYRKTGDLMQRVQRIWGNEQMLAIASTLVVSIRKRAFKDGNDVNDKSFAAYSTRPIYISNTSNTARRLKPKGGRNTGRGTFYAGGYSEYKRKSQKSRSSKVNLTLSGQLQRSVRIVKLTKFEAKIDLVGPARVYGGFVDEKRPFMGISPKDSKVIQALFRDVLKASFSQQGFRSVTVRRATRRV